MKFHTSALMDSFTVSRPARGGWIEISNSACVTSPVSRPVPRGAGGLKYDASTEYIRHLRPVPRGAGGLKYIHVLGRIFRVGPVPRGAGGLKSVLFFCFERSAPSSRPARGGWIEMNMHIFLHMRSLCPVPRGAGGLKCFFIWQHNGHRWGPVPRGAGGLKS